MSACKTFSHPQVHQLLDEVLGPGLHAKRIASLADAALGVMHTASLAVCTIGHGLAVARSLNFRYAVKQVVRMLSNPGIARRYARSCAGLDHAMSEGSSCPVWETLPAERQHGLVRTLGQWRCARSAPRQPHTRHRGDRR